MRSHSILMKAKISLSLVLFLIIASPAFTSSQAPATMFCPLPSAETETVIARWLMDAGFETSRKPLEEGTIEIKALKGSELWRIIVKPYSPLSSHVTAEYTLSGQPDHNKIRQLQIFIDDYTGKTGREIPLTVSAQKGYTVCIRAGNEEHIQFSGFIVGKDGLIVSIAHDLDTVRDVTVLLNNGEELRGRVVRMDFDRDLSLIDVDREIASPISLSKARDLLETGEKVYAIGCSNDQQSSIHYGIISGPPVMVNNLPLWQVDMETLHGTSGGPVFDDEGNLAGIVKGRYRGTNSRGFLITVGTLMEFLKEK